MLFKKPPLGIISREAILSVIIIKFGKRRSYIIQVRRTSDIMHSTFYIMHSELMFTVIFCRLNPFIHILHLFINLGYLMRAGEHLFVYPRGEL